MTTSPRKLTINQQIRRARILDAARQLVAENDYDGMIMRDVALLADVSPTTLYNLYNTKDELLLEALRESIAEGWAQAAREVPELGFERLLAQMRASAQQTLEAPAYAKAICRALFRAGPDDQIVATLVIGIRHAVIAALEEMVRRRELRPKIDVGTLATRLVGVFWANFFLWTTGVLDVEDLEDELRTAYLTTLLPVTCGSAHRRIQQLLGNKPG